VAVSVISTGIQFSDSSVQTTRSGIKSVQSIFAYPKGSLTGDYGSSRAVNITISSVNTSKSFILLPNSINSQVNYSIPRMITAKFIDSTTIQLCVNTSFNVYNARIEIIEFY
jgi:hypothetical protein